MNVFIFLCFLALLPRCAAIVCYTCNGVTTSGCNDPFNPSSASATSIGNTYCKKLGAAGVITRSGETTCSGTSWNAGSGSLCCQTDFCNGSGVICQTPTLLLLCIATIFIGKFY